MGCFRQKIVFIWEFRVACSRLYLYYGPTLVLLCNIFLFFLFSSPHFKKKIKKNKPISWINRGVWTPLIKQVSDLGLFIPQTLAYPKMDEFAAVRRTEALSAFRVCFSRQRQQNCVAIPKIVGASKPVSVGNLQLAFGTNCWSWREKEEKKKRERFMCEDFEVRNGSYQLLPAALKRRPLLRCVSVLHLRPRCFSFMQIPGVEMQTRVNGVGEWSCDGLRRHLWTFLFGLTKNFMMGGMRLQQWCFHWWELPFFNLPFWHSQVVGTLAAYWTLRLTRGWD